MQNPAAALVFCSISPISEIERLIKAIEKRADHAANKTNECQGDQHFPRRGFKYLSKENSQQRQGGRGERNEMFVQIEVQLQAFLICLLALGVFISHCISAKQTPSV